MALYDLDTSAVVKRDVLETGTAWVQALTDPTAGNGLFLLRLAQAEMVAAITRRERTGHIAAADAVTALADFAHDFVHQYFFVELSAGLISHAAALAARHALRGYDAMQLAGALEVQTNIPALVLVSADADLNTAAAAEGLPVENPSSRP